LDENILKKGYSLSNVISYYCETVISLTETSKTNKKREQNISIRKKNEI